MNVSLHVPQIAADDTVLDAAVKYMQAGWFVGPLAQGTKHPGSHLGKGWHTKTSRSVPDAYAWFEGHPELGIFLHVGKSGAVVIDVDYPENLPEDLKAALNPKTAFVDASLAVPFQSSRTGKEHEGQGHYIFKAPEGMNFSNSTGALGKGWGDVRGANGVIVVAPTVHVDADTNGLYQWKHTGRVHDLPATIVTQLAQHQDGVEALDLDTLKNTLAAWTGDADPALLDRRLAKFEQELEGGRHEALVTASVAVMCDGRAGKYSADLAVRELSKRFVAAVTQPGKGQRTEASAKAESLQVFQWAAAQVAEKPDSDFTDPAGDWMDDGQFSEVIGGLRRDVDGFFANDAMTEAVEEDESILEKFPRVNWRDLWADEATEEWILEPLVPARRLVSIFSEPKAGKSLLALEIAAGLATQRRVLGVVPNRPYRVMYIDHENDPVGDTRTRLQDMGYGPDDFEALENLYLASYPSMRPLDTPGGASEILAMVDEWKPEVVIIDTTSRVISGDENAADTFLHLYRETLQPLKARGVTVLRLDHSGKDADKGTRGSSAKQGDVDAQWVLKSVKAKTAGYDGLTLECTHSRMKIAESEMVVHRLDGPLRHEVQGGRTIKGENVRAKKAEIFRILEAEGIPQDAGYPTVRATLKAEAERPGGTKITIGDELLKDFIRERKAEAWIDGA